MEVRIVDNVSLNMASVLSAAIEHSNDVRIAVAFVSQTGLGMIWDSMATILQAGAYIEFLVGLDLQTTEPDALQSLFELSRHNTKVSLYCYSKANPTGIYHPKLYLMKEDNEVTSVVGSSNLTAGGLKKNMEINVVLRANILDEAISQCYDIYDRLKFHENKIEPDEEYLLLYKELRSCGRKLQGGISRDATLRELRTRFNEKTKSLRRPALTSRDIVGWRRLVYDALPLGEFTTGQMYEYEQQFQQQYPGNSKIKEKIRQQLQALRDKGLVEHVARGHWHKISDL
jgi:HKD family nuclease